MEQFNKIQQFIEDYECGRFSSPHTLVVSFSVLVQVYFAMLADQSDDAPRWGLLSSKPNSWLPGKYTVKFTVDKRDWDMEVKMDDPPDGYDPFRAVCDEAIVNGDQLSEPTEELKRILECAESEVSDIRVEVVDA